MKKVAKLVLIDPDDKYLLMHRNNHPTFGIDPDLPGGTLEEGEILLETMLREVQEEAGIAISRGKVQEVYSGVGYSRLDTHYALFVASIESRPEVILSWEHSSYEWLDRASFLKKAKNANDKYMHMVYDVLRGVTAR